MTSKQIWQVLCLTWVLALFSPIALYMLPFINESLFDPNPGLSDRIATFQWSSTGPDPLSVVIVLFLTGLSCGIWATYDSHAQDAKASVSEKCPAQKNIDDRYARRRLVGFSTRFALTIALLLLIYFVALVESSITYGGHSHVGRIVPRAINYAPLLAVMTTFTVLHVPRRHRVFGKIKKIPNHDGRSPQ